MRPCKVLLGMRMPEYERALVTAAAKYAGISIIEELYINDLDILDSKAIQDCMIVVCYSRGIKETDEINRYRNKGYRNKSK